MSKNVVIYGRVEKYCRIQKNEVNYRISRKLLAKIIGENYWRKLLAKIIGEKCWRKMLAKNVGEKCWRK